MTSWSLLHFSLPRYSCLDGATSGSRLIQSVGSPYQGTALAGSIADLGAIFGAGCGSVNDLTYSGAANWLTTIPSWARAEVYYYTTTFYDEQGCLFFDCVYDYCHLGSDLLLSE